jgi:hypothetical protein
MPRLPRLLLVLLVLLGACHSSTAPKGYNAGTWMSAAVPSGAYTEFSLDTVAGAVRGDGRSYGLMGVLKDSITVTGYVSYPVIALRFTYSTGGTAVYTARFVGADQLLGTWAVPGQTPRDSVSYFRETVFLLSARAAGALTPGHRRPA